MLDIPSLQIFIFKILTNEVFKILFWCAVYLQCCVGFRCIAKRSSYTYINLFFFRFFSFIDYYRILSIVPCAI